MHPRLVPAIGLALTLATLPTTRASLAGDAAPDDPFAAGLRALKSSDPSEAIGLLASVPETHEKYTEAMITLGYQIYGRMLRRPEQGVPYVQRAYEKAPGDMAVAKAYVDIMVLSGKAFPSARPERPHSAEVQPEFAHLAGDFRGLLPTTSIPREKLEEDLDFLEIRLEHCYSYLERRGVDYRGALDAIRASLKPRTQISRFAIQLAMFFALFGDMHSGLMFDVSSLLTPGYAPFAAAGADGRVVAFAPDRKGFIDSGCPFLAGIDGVPLERWLASARRLVPRGSTQSVERRALTLLVLTAFLRQDLGLSASPEVLLELESRDRSQKTSVSLSLGIAPVQPAPFVERPSGRIGDFGYLRIPRMEMDAAFLAELDQRMEKFRETRGIIIDVRENGGGTQDALKTLLPYFLSPDDSLQIVNVAAYRLPLTLPKPNPSGFLGLHGRSLHPVTSPVWKPEEAESIRRFLESFKPSWVPPAGKFTDWHVMAIHPRSNPRSFPYSGHVCVLSDAGSASATDNFLGAFKGRPNVTIVGAPSSGGSGRMQDYRLPNSGLPFTLSQMASYSRSGQLYDGHGVQPDVVVEAAPEDQVRKGDAVLDAALAILRERRASDPPAPPPSGERSSPRRRRSAGAGRARLRGARRPPPTSSPRDLRPSTSAIDASSRGPSTHCRRGGKGRGAWRPSRPPRWAAPRSGQPHPPARARPTVSSDRSAAEG